MSKTLLQIVKVANHTIGGGDIKSIFLNAGGTEDSEEIAIFARELWQYMQGRTDWPHQKKLIQLDALADSEKPNYLKLPDNVSEIVKNSLRYREQQVTYLESDAFLDFTNSRNTIVKDDNGIESNSYEDNVEIVDSMAGVNLYIRNDKNPTYWTTFDDEYLVFDSYDSVNEDTLQNENSSALAYVNDDLVIADDSVVDLPIGLMSLFQAELNREAHLRIKREISPIDEKRALAGWNTQKKKRRAKLKKKSGFGRN